MRNIKIYLFIFFILILAISAAMFLTNDYKQGIRPVRAGAGDNVSGFAWSENIGWVSFNTIDCDTNDNSAYDVGDAGPAGCPPPGTPFFDYGVNVDPATGDFSGYAWSSNIGWISFQENNPPDFAFSVNCDDPTSCDDAGDNCSACYNSTDSNIYGWANVLSLGDDGWIKLRGSGDVSPSNLIGHWKFDEGSGDTIADSSATGNNGSRECDGGSCTEPVWQDESNCVFGQCLYYDGVDDYVDIGHVADYQIPAGSVSLWFKTSLPIQEGDDYRRSMFSKDHLNEGDGSDVILFAANEEGNNLAISRLQGIGPPFDTCYQIKIEISDSGWHHLVYSFDGVGESMYLDGVGPYSDLELEYYGEGLMHNEEELIIGAANWKNPTIPLGNFFTGYIDDVRIYNKVLSGSEIRDLYYDYGVSIDINPISPTFGEFSGWAWNGDGNKVGIGWLSFNCADHNTCNAGDHSGEICGNDSDCDTSGVCPGCCVDTCANFSDYKVIILNQPPTVTSMTAPVLNDFCGDLPAHTVKRALLQWVFQDDNGDSQGAYRIIFDDDNDVDFETENIFDTGMCDAGAIGTGICNSDQDATSYIAHNEAVLNYGQPYYWWLKVWDNNGAESIWYSSDSHFPATANFTVPPHEYPTPDFSWFPVEPSQDEDVEFNPDTSTGDGVPITGWSWVFENGNPATSNAPYPITSFSGSGNWSTTLTATDSTGYSCSLSKPISVKSELPTWKEVK